jgi:hypothetical protein
VHRGGETHGSVDSLKPAPKPVAARLRAVRRLLATLLLALLPLQFSWAAVAVYCGHEAQAGAGHFGHHEHQHHANANSDAAPVADLDAPTDAQAEKAPGALDLDCGHCHGACCVMLTLPLGLPGALSTAPPSASLDEMGGAHAPIRPERPKWLPLV